MSESWRAFWSGYRTGPAASEADLFVQVGKTVSREPVPLLVFREMVQQVVDGLDLQSTDHLVDLCCGNGLITHALAHLVEQITAIDFAEHLIDSALRFKAKANIRYCVGDVETALSREVKRPPDKVLMNDSLGYFTPESFGLVLDSVLALTQDRPMQFLVTGVPAYALRWSFYDTPERRMRFMALEQEGGDTFDGMGRWWREDELREIGALRRLDVEIAPQSPALSEYRINVAYRQRGTP